MTGQPIKVTYLLAVWGEKYIRQFMDLSLRSLLAPGNIPGLAEHAESTFIFLTSKPDRKLFTDHPMFRRLTRFCRVEFVVIDDLIFGGNYSATLTLAYERGMRHAGTEMLATYFIYLVADYVMADGSLLNLLPYMQRGVSGITAGNFQVVEEDLLEAFHERTNPTTGVLAIPPRELMAITLPHLHPLTIANTVNQNFSHTEHTNRMFWKVDGETLIGRFYLRHMLCIKPEIDDYVIGASCDYSYIAEMCPSGNVVHIADSDEYCVIELQPFAHEQNFIKHGAFSQGNMVQALGKWLTRVHRDNILSPVIYHAGDISAEALDMVEKSELFVTCIEHQLPAKAQPTRGHPYWVSCLEGVLSTLILLNNQGDYFRRGVFAGIVGSPTFEPPLGKSYGDYHLLKMVRYRYGSDWRTRAIKYIRAISDSEATGHLWHREYAHSRAINAAIADAAQASDKCYVISYDPTGYADWCYQTYGDRVILQKADLFNVRSVASLKRQAPHASHAVVLMPVAYLHKLGEMLAKCNACLSGEKKVTVIVTQKYFERRGKKFKEYLAVLAAYYASGAVEVESFTTVYNPVRKWLDLFYQRQVSAAMQRDVSLGSLLKRILPVAGIIIASTGYILGNILSRTQRYPHSGNPTCAILKLRLTGRSSITLYSESRLRKEMETA